MQRSPPTAQPPKYHWGWKLWLHQNLILKASKMGNLLSFPSKLALIDAKYHIKWENCPLNHLSIIAISANFKKSSDQECCWQTVPFHPMNPGMLGTHRFHQRDGRLIYLNGGLYIVSTLSPVYSFFMLLPLPVFCRCVCMFYFWAPWNYLILQPSQPKGLPSPVHACNYTIIAEY